MRLHEGHRMTLRVVAAFLAYAVYRLVEPRDLAAGIFFAAGTLVILWAVVDRITLTEPGRRMWSAGVALLGLGLFAAGAVALF